MKAPGRRRGFSLIIAAFSLLTLASSSSPSKVGTRPALPGGEQPTAAKNETRLRKLHLVRPDLIPYPIAYEVYC